MSDKRPLYALPIAQRPPRGPRQVARAIAYVLFLVVSLCVVNGSQFLCLPLAILPATRGLYADCIRKTKAAFGLVLVLSSQFFAPTQFRITYDASNAEGQRWVERNTVDAKTAGFTLNWPKKVVMIANHQVYSDWWYLWALSYFANMHAHVLIVLKKSLKWVPIGGWGMQFFQFIFLARSWAADKDVLTSRLSALAAHHTTTTSELPEDDEPLNFMIFPEGTLISKQTLPISRKYADKMGYTHPNNTLLPRSTGLHTSLLALSQIPSLHLMDVTMAYPGIPKGKFGQDYYTLRSIFMDGIAPPEVVCHVRLFNVQRDVPLRANRAQQQDNGMTLQQRKEAAKAAAKRPDLLETSEEDKQVFDSWLRERWAEKDAMLEEWYDRDGKGPLARGENIEEVVFPIQMKGAIGFL